MSPGTWLLGSNQSCRFLSGLPRYVLAVLYTTYSRAVHSSSGVEFSLSSHCARALSISCSKLSLRLVVLRFAVLGLAFVLVPCLLCFCRILKTTFGLSIGPAVCSTHGSVPRMSILSRHLVTMKSIICQCLERGYIQVVLRSLFCFEHGVRHYQLELRAQSQ